MGKTSRIRLTDKSVTALPFAERGQYIKRDAELPGFFVVVGRSTKTFTIQVDVPAPERERGQRSIRKALGRHGEMSVRDARAKARETLGAYATGSRRPASGVTLKEAWERYHKSHLVRKGRSPRTIQDYEFCITKLLGDWLDTPLARLSENTGLVAARFDTITEKNGPYAANHAMRALRAVYRYARKLMDRSLPPDHPAMAVDFNPEKRRKTALSGKEWAKWEKQRQALANPIRREFHLLILLSGSRPDALTRARWEHLDRRKRTLFFPEPKGGEEKAFYLPLSKPMLDSFKRVKELGAVMHPRQAKEWIFPAESAPGHITEYKQSRERKKGSSKQVLFKYGGDLRQTYRTVAQEVGVSKIDAHLLLNHALKGVSEGYITPGALLDHLREQQERISRKMLQKLQGKGKR